MEDLASRGHRRTTPCGDGELVWREWGAGAPVVLLHGGFGSWLHWIRNIDALAARHRVLAVDMPGLGDSAMPAPPLTPQAMGLPIARGLEALLASGERCHLVGFSFGGLVSGQVAALLGERIESLTLVGSSGLGLPRKRVELVRRTAAMSPDELREAQAYNIRALLLHHRDSVDDLALAIQAHNDARARVASRRMSLGDSLRHVLPALRGRLNGIWGQHDVTGSPGMRLQQELLASLHPAVDFRVVDDAGHWVQFEAHEAFNEALVEMLAV
jgi:pimeloyl-ACP methyl ester carboxylesterase